MRNELIFNFNAPFYIPHPKRKPCASLYRYGCLSVYVVRKYAKSKKLVTLHC